MINFNSSNPIIIQFPRFAGGKFISNCLSLSKHAVPQDKTLAEYLLLRPDDYQFRFDNLINTLPPPHDMINWITYYELGDTQFFGVIYTGASNQIKETENILEVPRLDLARDSHHFDIKTSKWISAQILTNLSKVKC